jgi:hypothetical protein
MKTPILFIAFLGIALSHTRGEVGAIPIAELAQRSDLIVIATVESVSEPTGEKVYATAKVMEVWKGPHVGKVEFLASGTWTCDISEAELGEAVLLFLTTGPESRSLMIAHSGRGRMPLRTLDGKRYATFWEEILLPETTATIPGPDRASCFIRSLEVEVFRSLVKQATLSPTSGDL